MCFASRPPVPAPTVMQAAPPEPTLPTARAPLEAKKKKKENEEDPKAKVAAQDLTVSSALGIPSMQPSMQTTGKVKSDSFGDYKTR